MLKIYKYNKFGELVSFKACLNEITTYSQLYVNKSKSYYTSIEHMTELKEIRFEELYKYNDNVIIYHAK